MQPIDDLTNMVELILAIYSKEEISRAAAQGEIARAATLLMDANSEQGFLMSLANWYLQKRDFQASIPAIDQNLDSVPKFLRMNWDYIANSYTIASANFTPKETHHDY